MNAFGGAPKLLVRPWLGSPLYHEAEDMPQGTHDHLGRAPEPRSMGKHPDGSGPPSEDHRDDSKPEGQLSLRGRWPADFARRRFVIGALRLRLKFLQVGHRIFLGAPSANNPVLTVRVNLLNLVGPTLGDDPVIGHDAL
jgi:hypothetical protein